MSPAVVVVIPVPKLLVVLAGVLIKVVWLTSKGDPELNAPR